MAELEEECSVAASAVAGEAKERDASSVWRLFSQNVPKGEVVFLCQVIVLFTVVCCSLYNLTTKDANSPLWISLLNASIFVMLPNPRMGECKKKFYAKS